MEGPGVKVIADKLAFLENRMISDCGGNTRKLDTGQLIGKRIVKVTHYGKNLLIQVNGVGYVKVHFLMYGSCSINRETRDEKFLRLRIEAGPDKVYFYNCSVSLLDRFDFKSQDILSDDYRVDESMAKLKKYEGYVCDALLDQDLFPGVGNIIKVEGLYLARIHPLSICGHIPEEGLRALIEGVREFSRKFYEVRKRGDRLKNYTMCYGKKTCGRCGRTISRKRTGEKARISYFCEGCQVLY